MSDRPWGGARGGEPKPLGGSWCLLSVRWGRGLATAACLSSCVFTVCSNRPVLVPSECNVNNPCEGLSRHATFENFGMAFLTLFRVSTGDNWNGIMKVRAAQTHTRAQIYKTLSYPELRFFLDQFHCVIRLKFWGKKKKEVEESGEKEPCKPATGCFSPD